MKICYMSLRSIVGDPESLALSLWSLVKKIL